MLDEIEIFPDDEVSPWIGDPRAHRYIRAPSAPKQTNAQEVEDVEVATAEKFVSEVLSELSALKASGNPAKDHDEKRFVFLALAKIIGQYKMLHATDSEEKCYHCHVGELDDFGTCKSCGYIHG